MNILVLLSGLTNLLDSWGITGLSALNGNEVSRLYYFLIPLFLNLSFSTLLAKEKDLDPIGTLLIAMVCFFRVSGFLSVSKSAELMSHHGSILTSIPCTWLAVQLLSFFASRSRLGWVEPQANNISPRLGTTLNLILPGLLTVLCFELLGESIQRVLATGVSTFAAQSWPSFDSVGAIPELILFKAVSLFTWFIGLHGEHSADGLFRLLNNVPTGESYSIRLKGFHDVFMNIGGSGSTFIIPLIVLFDKRIAQFKSIARLGLPFSFFNVNEILLFGLPILLNPIFFVPFLLAPFVNMLVALIAIHLELFSISPAPIHWMSVPLYSAYIATDGSAWAVVTQLFCIAVDGLIYWPFLVLASRQYEAPFHLRQLLEEDAYGLVKDAVAHRQERRFVAQQKAMLETVTSAHQVFQQLKSGQLILYFQPKFSAESLRLVGLEALLRFQNHRGEVLPPTFLPVLYRQGLSKVVDKKVVNLAFQQILEWRARGLAVPPVALNFDKDFLLDEQAVQAFINRAKQHQVRFYLEITEHTYTVELTALASVIRQLRAAGHQVSIDDFGAGYSSLTTLLDLEADEIKLDRKLAIAPQSDPKRGTMLLAASVQLCHDLGFQVVAEGIENGAQLALVQRCGVDVIQGYYLGRPMPPSQVSELFSKPATSSITTSG